MEFSLPRGLRDIPPEESQGAEAVREAFLDTCRLFDYKLMEPSSLELLETLEAKSGSGVKDEIYFFKDKSGRDLGLRFDLTVGITRYVAQRRELASPIRLGAFSSVWRYDEPQYGRYRWFYQWDAELFGPNNPEADAEIIEFSVSLFNRLGTKPKVSLGSRKILEAYIRTNCEITEDSKVLDMLRAIDKSHKKSADLIAKEYSSSFSKSQFDEVLHFVTKSSRWSETSEVFSDSKIDPSPLLSIVDSLKNRGVKDTAVDLSITRGIDYYTDMVFEAYDSDNPRLGALCGGGRFDTLPSVFGRPELGACGVAGGVERAVLAYKLKRGEALRIYVAPIGSDERVRKFAASIGANLRKEGIPTQSEITGKSLRKILEAQSELGTEAVIIIGEKELSENIVKIKWMKSGKETTSKVTEITNALGVGN